jgi:hypothetical protein
VTMNLPHFLRQPGTSIPRDRVYDHESEAGDTLLEVLIAIVVIAIGVVALLGALTTSITSSATYRSLATLDTLLKSFSEAVKYDVQLQPAATSQYQNCASSYQVVSEYPTSAVIGAGVTVFGTGFNAGSSVPVTLGTSPPISVGNPTVATNGSVSTTFTLPSLPPGTTTVPILINSVPSATPLNIESTGTSSSSPVAGYTVAISSIGWWNTSTAAFDTGPTCSPSDDSGIQMITVQASAPNNVGDNLSFIVTDPAFQPDVTVSANPGSVLFPSSSPGGITFTASVTGSSGEGTPSGSINWAFNDIPGTPPQAQPCPPTRLVSAGNISTATCTVAPVVAGSYQVIATYSPPSSGVLSGPSGVYGPATGYASASAGTTPTAAIQIVPPTPASPMTFTVNVTAIGSYGQPAPTGAISWITSSPDLSCGGSSTLSPTSTGTTTCTATLPGAYQVTAVYPGDSNYQSTTWPSASVDIL